MICGTGVDIARVSRIAAVWQRHPRRFALRILHPRERPAWEACTSDQAGAFLAKRFAAKEAASKALGTAIRGGIAMQDFIVSRGDKGRPLLELSGRASEEAGRRGITHWHLSLSDEADTVVAFVVAEARP
ncbi:MAG: holo-ACP synthase [Pseudomonadota bacterium]